MEIALNFLMRRLATQYLRGSGISRARFRYSQQYPTRLFHASPVVQKVVPFMLADIGEGEHLQSIALVTWTQGSRHYPMSGRTVVCRTGESSGTV